MNLVSDVHTHTLFSRHAYSTIQENVTAAKAQGLELLPVPSDSFGCHGWVRVGYCVSYDTIVNSMPAWKKLKELYQ